MIQRRSSRLPRTLIFPWKWSRLSHLDHSTACTDFEWPFHSSSTAFTTDSFSPCQNSLQMSWSNSTSTPMAVTPSRAQIAKRLGQSKVMLALSPLLLPWLEHQDRASDLPMELLGQWWSVKSNWDRCRDHRACLRFSFLDVWKYTRFLWSIQILNWHGVHLRKCHHSSSAWMMANISLLWIS